MIALLSAPLFRGGSDQTQPPQGLPFRNPQRRLFVAEVMQCYKAIEEAGGGYMYGRSRGRGRGYQVLQAIRSGGRGNFRGNAKGGFQTQQSYPSQQETTQFGQYFDPTQSVKYGAAGEAKCGKCGLNRHSNVLYCPANNQQCLLSGHVGHFKRCCRLAGVD